MAYAIKSMGLGEILDQGIAILKNRFKTLLAITGFLYLPVAIVQTFLILAITPQVAPGADQQAALEVVREVWMKLFLVSMAFIVIHALIVTPLTNGAMIHNISNEYLGSPVSAWTSFRYALGVMLPLMGTSILAGVLILLGFLLFVIPGIYMGLKYWLSSYVVVLEKRSGMAALRRSGELMKENYGALMTLGFMFVIISIIINTLANMVPGAMLRALAQVFIQAILVIFTSAASVVFYYSARCKHENFDLMVLAESVGKNPEGSPQMVSAGSFRQE